MADLAPSLTSILLPRLGQEASVAGGIRQWLISEPYTASISGVSNVITLHGINLAKLIKYIAFDYERFSLSSRESFSISILESQHHNLISWPMIKVYYAAFFAAHAIMRASGAGIVKVERQQALMIDQVVSAASGAPANFSAGMYQYSIIENVAGQIEIELKTHNSGTGVHDGFWRSFLTFLDERASNAVSTGAAGASDFVAGASELRPALQGWLSARRNDINYQHAFGVWFPVVKSKKSNHYVRSLVFKPSRSIDVTIGASEVESFLNVSQFLSCLNCEIGEFLSARSPGRASFGAKWRKFGNLYPHSVL
ncbi:hypothetical protein VHN57_15455 [Sphingobium sp. WW5]|uniref:hypothetical protein n=1 Tax=unclassified Sphingobium TaxID=2611147 RepID=UPI003C197447